MRYVFYILLLMTLLLAGCADKPRERGDVVERRDKKITTEKPANVLLKSTTHKLVVREKQEVAELQRETGKKSKKKIPGKVVAAVPKKPLEIEPEQQKKVFEFVQIAGENYPVPRPWRGKRIAEKSPPFSELQQIPVEYTWNQSKLFIRRDACEAFVAMARAAARDDVDLRVHSGFRSIWYQKNIFTNLMAEGRTWEDLVRYVAPPGYSEHMLGTVVDLYPSNWEFASSEAYRWLQEHAADFGFSETYPEDGSDGFPWEAWHWRYIASPPSETAGLSPKETVAKYGEAKQQQ